MEIQPLRIIQYIGSLNSGGSQSMIMNIYRNIDRSKIQFDFIIDRKNEILYKDEIEKLGGKVYIFDEYFNGKNFFNFKKQWVDFFRTHTEYKVIHCHVRSVASIVLNVAKKYGLITICHSHSTSNGNGIKAIVKKILQGKIKRNCDYFFACSKESAIWLYGNKIASSDKCYIINNAIDSRQYRYNQQVRELVRKNFNIENKIVLGQVGRLIEIKNYEFTIKILKELVQENKDYFLMIVGTGQLKNKIEQQLDEYGLKNNVIILENRNDVNELMQAMDIFLMPSLWEGLPLALVEAQSASLPCIISKNILSGIVIEDNVKRLNIDNIELWTNTIKELINAKIVRKDESKKIIENGFDIKENVEKISNFYISLYK